MARRLPFLRGSRNLAWALALSAGLITLGFAPPDVRAGGEDDPLESLDQGHRSPPELGFPGDDDQPTIRGRGRQRDYVGPTPSAGQGVPNEPREEGRAEVQSKRSNRFVPLVVGFRGLLRSWWAMIR